MGYGVGCGLWGFWGVGWKRPFMGGGGWFEERLVVETAVALTHSMPTTNVKPILHRSINLWIHLPGSESGNIEIAPNLLHLERIYTMRPCEKMWLMVVTDNKLEHV